MQEGEEGGKEGTGREKKKGRGGKPRGGAATGVWLIAAKGKKAKTVRFRITQMKLFLALPDGQMARFWACKIRPRGSKELFKT